MAFQKTPLGKPSFRIKELSKRKNHLANVYRKVTTSIAAGGIIFVFLILGGLYLFIKNLDVSFGFVVDTVATVFGEEWEQDLYGHTNILLFGAGGGDHDGPDLTDSLMVMSYDHETHNVSMLSLPRDLYVAYPGLNNYADRINGIYDYGKRNFGSKEGAEMLREKIEQITGADIHYYLKIDFRGFEEIVDELGGVEVDVPEDILDTTYPDGNYGYETFRLEKGLQVLDGATALKFARSRHSTSDFDRSARQQLVIAALKESALKNHLLTDFGKLKRLFIKFQDNIETDFTMGEILYGAKVGRKIDTNRIATGVLNDDPTSKGGFLYTPPRENFNGAFVLLPDGAYAGNVSYYRDIQLFTELLFYNAEVFIHEPKVEILNATTTTGIATRLSNRLTRYGFEVANIGNSQSRGNVEETKFYFYPDPEKQNLLNETLDMLSLFVPGEPTEGTEVYKEKGYDVTIVLGNDYKEPLTY